MKKLEIKDSLLDSFKNQESKINLSKINGGSAATSIGHRSVKTLLQGGETIQDSIYQPD